MSAEQNSAQGNRPTTGGTLIHNLTREELSALCRELHLPEYRAGQIWKWLYESRVSDWAAMKNVPKSVQALLAERFCLNPAVPIEVRGEPGATRKILLQLRDGERIETVLIPAADRRTVCVSSQVGCRYRCAFCASGLSGFRRHLETGEMVGQVLAAARLYEDRPTHIVFMGIGEPFDNYDAVLKAVTILNDAEGLHIGARRITISTSGVIPGIRRLASENIQIELSVSLHAPTNELRSSLMPVNRKYPLPDLFAACREYTRQTKRIITFEYTLILGVNDSRAQAEELVRQLSGMPCRVNLIPLSPVPEYSGAPSSRDAADMFIELLDKARINATWRNSKGSTLNAACGQLRAERTTTS